MSFNTPTPDDQHTSNRRHNGGQPATLDDFVPLFRRALWVVCHYPDWQTTFEQRARRVDTDAFTLGLVHETLCAAEDVRTRFPGRDAALLAVASTL